MALNLQYDAIGKSFVQQYYMLFDDPIQRPNLVNMYNVMLRPVKSILLAVIVVSFPNYHKPPLPSEDCLYSGGQDIGKRHFSSERQLMLKMFLSLPSPYDIVHKVHNAEKSRSQTIFLGELGNVFHKDQFTKEIILDKFRTFGITK